jgi:hypothetical protein
MTRGTSAARYSRSLVLPLDRGEEHDVVAMQARALTRSSKLSGHAGVGTALTT